MSPHCRWGASGRGAWAACAGRNNLISSIFPAGVPDNKTPASIWGDQGHDHGAKALNYIFNKGPMPQVIADPEMSDQVKMYVGTVADDLAPCKLAGHRFVVLVEHEFRMLMGGEIVWGTADCVTYCYTCRVIRVYDLKTGWHEVDAVENAQLLYYGTGALLTTDFEPLEGELVIVQPRGGVPKRWEVDVQRLVDEALKINAEINAGKDPNAPLTPGAHCRYCPVAAICPAQREANYAMAALEFDKVPDAAYDPAVLAQCLDAVDRIEDWISEVRNFAQNEANHGRVPPGYKIVQGRQGNRAWVDESLTISTLAKYAAVQQLYEDPDLKSPAQMEKLIPPAERETVMEKLTTRPPGGRKLVKASDPRPQIACTPQDEFTDLTKKADLI